MMMTSIVLLKPGFFAGVDMSVVAWAKPPVLSVFPGVSMTLAKRLSFVTFLVA
jgi:hypothetical protein